ncbi:MAG: alkaline phosphatase [Epulopiscium sp. Nele67-Bin001]|nr:MAG: alkaline phosphatase [Epulopiscium sp. Nele67-Bin001]
MKLAKKTGIVALAVATLIGGLAYVAPQQQELVAKELSTSLDAEEVTAPKYIFMFVGDGLAYTQVNAAQVYRGTAKYKDTVEVDPLAFAQFPTVGTVYTQDATSFAPDSASTITALTGGVQTHSGVVGMDIDKVTPTYTIAERLRDEGYKIGVLSSVTLNHATPAGYYAHQASRNNYYDIALELGASNFDYFAGGALSGSETGDGTQQNIYEVLEEEYGYTILRDKEDILALDNTAEKVYAINPELHGGAMLYSIDMNEDSITLADLVQKGIDVLDNDENGFFMSVESGKIDWAGHANDAMANIGDTIAFDDAVQVAIDFYNEHPDETLIIVTGDHETGGMTIGQTTTGYDTAFQLLSNQKVSYEKFDNIITEFKEENPNGEFTDMLPIIEEYFGLVAADNATSSTDELLILSDYEYKKLEEAFAETMKAKADRNDDIEALIAYGGYEPLSVTLTHVLNNKAGVGWTSYYHTGQPVPLYAIGAGHEIFSGSYNNTEVYHKLVELCGLE